MNLHDGLPIQFNSGRLQLEAGLLLLLCSFRAEAALIFSFRNDDYNDSPGAGYAHISHSFVEPQRETTVAILTAAGAPSLRKCEWQIGLESGGGVYDEIPSFGVTTAANYKPRGETITRVSSHLSTDDSLGDDFFSYKKAAVGALKRTKTEHEFSVTFPSPGAYTLTAACELGVGDEVHGSAASSVAHGKSTVICRYVRRELRRLSQGDRVKFLNAFLALSKVETPAGVRKFGTQHFRSLVDLQLKHLKLTADKRQDHIHDGAGFLTQYSALTSEFELSLQTVEPSLSVPYWDYTIDSVEISKKHGKQGILDLFGGDPKQGLMLFSEDWFGATDSGNFSVTKGRFAYQKLPRNFQFEVRSPYGFLRAPWNLNPSEYVSRFHTFCGEDPLMTPLTTTLAGIPWPTCDAHFKFSNGDDDDLLDYWEAWAWSVSYMPHASLHLWVGGIGGKCDELSDLYDDGTLGKSEVLLLKARSFALLKEAYRKSIIEVPSFCTEDAGIECTWQCMGDIGEWEFTDFRNAGLLDLYTLANVTIDATRSNVALNNEPYDESEKVRKILHKVLCNTPFWPGDALEAASPVEASFWPIHPTLERLLQYRHFIRPFRDEAWKVDDSNICVRSGRSLPPAAGGVRAGKGCTGHHPYEVLSC